VDIEFPAECFSWRSNQLFSDQDLHIQDSPKLATLCAWFEGMPHVVQPGEPVNKTTLLQICLGMGILLKDANLIQFTEEGGHNDDTPAYIMQSTWEANVLVMLNNYISNIRGELVR